MYVAHSIKKTTMAKAAKETQTEHLEKQLWKAADKLRKNIDAAECKHVVLGLPDEEDDFNFAERFAQLKAEFEAQLLEEAKLNKVIAENLARVKI